MIYFITGNKGKLAEAKAILGEDKIEGLGFDLPEIQEIDAHAIIKEKLKVAKDEILKQVQDDEEFLDAELIVEDTSLYLDALNGLPGPLIKWFMKTIGNDGLFNLAKKLENNKAQAKTIIGYSDKEGNVEFFEGVIPGTIVAPKGEKGFGWDPVFKPGGYDKVFAEMDGEEKNMVSMRKIAFERLKEHLGE